jgi:hypothetical protein
MRSKLLESLTRNSKETCSWLSSSINIISLVLLLFWSLLVISHDVLMPLWSLSTMYQEPRPPLSSDIPLGLNCAVVSVRLGQSPWTRGMTVELQFLSTRGFAFINRIRRPRLGGCYPRFFINQWAFLIYGLQSNPDIRIT